MFSARRSVFLRGAVLPGLLLAGAVALVTAAIAATGMLGSVELLGYDALVRRGGPGPEADHVVIVDFDQKSVRDLRAFPIQRRLLGRVIDAIRAGDPAVIGVDVLLDWPRDEADDADLARAIEQAGDVVLVSFYGFGLSDPIEPLPRFADAAAMDPVFGDIAYDDDGFARRMYLVGTSEYPRVSFPLALASYGTQWELTLDAAGAVHFGPTRVPLATKRPRTALIRFAHSDPVPVVSVRELLDPDFDPTPLRGKIVIVGNSSEFGRDLHDTPAFRFDRPGAGRRKLSGAEIHAAAIETLLHERTIARMDNAVFWTGVFALCAILLTLVVSLRPVPGVLSVLAAMAGVFLLAGALFDARRIWMPFVTAEASIVLALPAGLGYRFLQERRLKALAEAERRQIMGLFERYVAPEVAARIWERRDEIVLAGEERTATVLFSDIRGFTALTAGKPSAEVLAWLNRYLTEMSEVVKGNGGFLNKFIGDGIMVLFGVPLSAGVSEDACGAVRTALQMLERVERLNADGTGQPEVRIGIGIHTGPLTAGNVGSPDRLEYSVIGETVNLASRLEALTKALHTSIVMSASTRDLVKNEFETVPLGESEVRGFEGTLALFSARRELRPEEQS